MSEEYQELAQQSTETFINLQDHEVNDLCKMYYYFKLTQTIGGKAPGLTHFQISVGALLIKIIKKTPDLQLTILMAGSNQLRDFYQNEMDVVVEFIKEYGTDKDREEYL